MKNHKKTYQVNRVYPPVTDDPPPPCVNSFGTVQGGSWRLDRPEGGPWRVCQHSVNVGEFENLGRAVRFFLQRSGPKLPIEH